MVEAEATVINFYRCVFTRVMKGERGQMGYRQESNRELVITVRVVEECMTSIAGHEPVQ